MLHIKKSWIIHIQTTIFDQHTLVIYTFTCLLNNIALVLTICDASIAITTAIITLDTNKCFIFMHIFMQWFQEAHIYYMLIIQTFYEVVPMLLHLITTIHLHNTATFCFTKAPCECYITQIHLHSRWKSIYIIRNKISLLRYNVCYNYDQIYWSKKQKIEFGTCLRLKKGFIINWNELST